MCVSVCACVCVCVCVCVCARAHMCVCVLDYGEGSKVFAGGALVKKEKRKVYMVHDLCYEALSASTYS